MDKLFVLKDENEQEQYKTLLNHIDEKIVELINDVIVHIRARFENDLNEHIHVALTDHITFAIKRLEQGLDIKIHFSPRLKHYTLKNIRLQKKLLRSLTSLFAFTFLKGRLDLLHSIFIVQLRIKV